MGDNLARSLAPRRDMRDPREKLAALSAGGSPERPIKVGSASVVEIRTAALACPLCGGSYRIEDHVSAASGLRRVDVACRHCSTPRSLWFRLVSFEPS
jgi:predicted Zn finger-like uncharacterized protein